MLVDPVKGTRSACDLPVCQASDRDDSSRPPPGRYDELSPDRRKLAGLTFATVDDKIDTVGVTRVSLARESPREHKLNVAFSLLLIATVVGLWIYFR